MIERKRDEKSYQFKKGLNVDYDLRTYKKKILIKGNFLKFTPIDRWKNREGSNAESGYNFKHYFLNNPTGNGVYFQKKWDPVKLTSVFILSFTLFSSLFPSVSLYSGTNRKQV